MLESEDPSVVSWTSNGKAFKVLDLDRFRDETLPKYFRHNKITSFQRQLNLYGYLRIQKGEDSGAYGHPKFIRGHREAVRDIRRLPNRPYEAAKKKKQQLMNGSLMPSSTSSSMIRVNRSSSNAPSCSVSAPNVSPRRGSNGSTVGVSLLSKNIGFGGVVVNAPSEQKSGNGSHLTNINKDLLFSSASPLDECREQQFKSTFHEQANPWRQVLSSYNEDALLRMLEDEPSEDALLAFPIVEVKRELADAEAAVVLPESIGGIGEDCQPMMLTSSSCYDFDLFFEGLRDASCELDEALADYSLDQEIIALLA